VGGLGADNFGCDMQMKHGQLWAIESRSPFGTEIPPMAIQSQKNAT